MAHPVVHFEIAGPDGERLIEFYRDLFGWEIQGAGPDYWLVTAGKEGIGGGVMQTRDEMPSYVTVYVATDDLEASLRRAGELGGETVVPPMEIPGTGSFAMFRDPSGNTIGLFRE
ncbi:VOC family protein [Nocardioides sp. NBC_00368]|uniref:VOC family protein n=1 Tax=Nocardioides sp. NBC_00368 TaxID=2976000 RepID=UPI002E1C624F